MELSETCPRPAFLRGALSPHPPALSLFPLLWLPGEAASCQRRPQKGDQWPASCILLLVWWIRHRAAQVLQQQRGGLALRPPRLQPALCPGLKTHHSLPRAAQCWAPGSEPLVPCAEARGMRVCLSTRTHRTAGSTQGHQGCGLISL